MCGILSIFLSLAGQLELACFLIYLAAVLDFFDGFIARKLNQMSELGKQLDSLADNVTFGVAPGVLMCVVLIFTTTNWELAAPINAGVLTFNEVVFAKNTIFLNNLSKGNWSAINPIIFTGLIIPFFSLFRLAKFNIDTRQSESFIGLPTPANTIFFTAFPLLMAKYYNLGESNAVLEFLLTPWVLIAIIVIMSLMLVAELPLFALKFKHFKFKGNEIRFIFLGACLLMIPLLLQWSIPMIIVLYLLLSVVDVQLKKAKG